MAENKHTISDLYQMQALPLSAKIRMTERRIYDWIDHFGKDGVAISFSGGKDSTVLMDIIRNRRGYKDIPAVFVDVPTQYPELREFALTWDNVEIIKPKISFMQVCEKYGFPLISKEVSRSVHDAKLYIQNGGIGGKYKWAYDLFQKDSKDTNFSRKKYKYMLNSNFMISDHCCYVMKKEPLHKYSNTHKKNILSQHRWRAKAKIDYCGGVKMDVMGLTLKSP